MNQRRFFGNDFFYKKFAYSASVKIRSRHSLCAEYRVLAKPNNLFWSRICKIRFKNRELVPTRAACCDCKCKNFPSRKITARFKLNLKTDGLDCKMIFKFGKHVERFHSTRKQCRRIYICELVGARPLHLLSQTVLSLKSPTGAFIAALRSANANFALQNTCWEHPNPWTASRGCRLF